jgi:hypothetical protein
MYCVVVRRGQFQQYDRLYEMFGDRVPVMWDRRRERAGDGTSTGAERRQSAPPSWKALGFVVVEKHDS